LSLSTGKTCALLSSSVIPNAESTINLIKASAARSLMTVPTILEQIISSPDHCKALAELDFVAIGGGPLSVTVGDALASQGVTLLNHYGATEIGAIAYICIPDHTFDWHYLRLRTDSKCPNFQYSHTDFVVGLTLREIESGRFKLSGHPFGWEAPFEIQDVLEKRFNDSEVMEVKVHGRTDDVIVLATGEKVSPQALESSLTTLAHVKTAVTFGERRNEVGVLIELQDDSAGQDTVEKLWAEIDAINQTLDHHARVPSKEAILIKPSEKTIPLSDKGSVMRNEVGEIFGPEIEAIYQRLSQRAPALDLTGKNLEDRIREVVQECLQDRVGSTLGNEDFFELGMDSLEVTRVSRRLGTRVELIYQNPTVAKLASAMRYPVTSIDRTTRMRETLSRYTRRPTTVLLTGSTGSLGAHILERLAKDNKVDKILCLNRKQPKLSRMDILDRQKSANSRFGVEIPDAAWDKIELLVADTQLPNLGLVETAFEEVCTQVTHVMHNAWPMDFQRTLESYESQLQIVVNLIELCQKATRKPELIFLSSIAVAGQRSHPLIAEKPLDDPSSTTPMGYAEAKWVCEQILIQSCLPVKVIRVGQVSGSEKTGYWNSNEHIPQLLKASYQIGALPNLQGVSKSPKSNLLTSHRAFRGFQLMSQPIVWLRSLSRNTLVNYSFMSKIRSDRNGPNSCNTSAML
jgi:nucleoside-diphosphate-sugar epimerase